MKVSEFIEGLNQLPPDFELRNALRRSPWRELGLDQDDLDKITLFHEHYATCIIQCVSCPFAASSSGGAKAFEDNGKCAGWRGCWGYFF